MSSQGMLNPMIPESIPSLILRPGVLPQAESHDPEHDLMGRAQQILVADQQDLNPLSRFPPLVKLPPNPGFAGGQPLEFFLVLFPNLLLQRLVMGVGHGHLKITADGIVRESH